jgi:ABC-type nitrate/sulfonate/bicarbonate transport system substrate-binding protein
MKTYASIWVWALFVATSPLSWGVVNQAHAQPKIPLTFYIISKTVGHAPFWVAEKNGFFAQENLDVKLAVTGSASAILSGVAGGSVQMSAGGGSDTILANQKGLPVVMIGGNLNAMVWMLVGQKQFKTMRDLKGQTIGVSGIADVMGTAVKAAMRTQGLEYPRDYSLIQLGGTPNQWAALQKEKVAATALAVPWGKQAVDAGYNQIAWMADHVPNYLVTVIIADRNWLARSRENRDVAVRFMKAMIRTYHWLNENKAEAVTWIADEFKFQPNYAENAWELYTGRIWPKDGVINRQAVAQTMAVIQDFGLISPPLPSLETLVDPTIVEQAQKELIR